ncbi:MAG: hypothetical protein WC307_01985 [Candidatus Nanoarchaeia archaeon]|jgi:tRNA nucleotidyltransferase (CCA-adding enzyme)
MSSFIEVVNKVSREVTPTSEELLLLKKVVFLVSSSLNKSLIKAGVTAQVFPGGSFAKRTFLRDSHDLDFFIRFRSETELKLFSQIVLDAFPNALVIHGSRDYYNVNINGLIVELIPVLLINDPSEALNSMDASYFHVDYINARINDSLRTDVLLLKQFFKACGVYGAESHINGFSGYVTELLILHFGGFKRFLEFIEHCDGSLFVDAEGYYTSVSKALATLKVNKLLSPVVIVDPVLATRNAAAGLNHDSFNKFLLNARLFLRKPTINFFRVKPLSVKVLTDLAIDRGHPLFIHQFVVKGKPDVFFSKLSRQLKQVKSLLEVADFIVYDYGFLTDGTVYFELERDSLPLTKRVVGPPVTIEPAHLDSFISKKAVNGPYVLDGKVCFDVKREVTRAKPFLLDLLKRIKF